jgi:hypothetical protein
MCKECRVNEKPDRKQGRVVPKHAELNNQPLLGIMKEKFAISPGCQIY